MVLLSAPALRLSDTVASAALRLSALPCAAAARRRALAERFDGPGGKLAERLFGVAGVGLDRFRKLFEPGIEKVRGGAAARLDLLADRFGAADQQMLEMADAAVERVGDPQRLGAEHLVDFGAALRRWSR